MPINPSGVKYFWSPHPPGLQSYEYVSQHYQRYRIPRPPDQIEEGSEPGKICWGSAGAMPSAEPMPTFGFTVKEHWKETSRESDVVRVENPDDPTQYVMEDRPKSLKFDKTTDDGQSGTNTASTPAEGIKELQPVYQTIIQPVSTTIRRETVFIEYVNPITPGNPLYPPTSR